MIIPDACKVFLKALLENKKFIVCYAEKKAEAPTFLVVRSSSRGVSRVTLQKRECLLIELVNLLVNRSMRCVLKDN